MSEVILQVENLKKHYGTTEALKGVSFELARGQILGLLGPNGAGKTTAIHILLDLLTPTSGQVRLFGHPLSHRRHDSLGRINFSSAYAGLPANLQAIENLFIFAQLYGIPDWKSKVRQLLDMFQIAHLAHRVTGGLSSGEQTRLNLCKALLNDPEILLLDEPTASLDPDMADQVRRTLRRIQSQRGMAILYTSHNMREVEEMCDQILFIHQGREVTRGKPQEVLNQFKTQTLEEVFIRIARSGDLVSESTP